MAQVAPPAARRPRPHTAGTGFPVWTARAPIVNAHRQASHANALLAKRPRRWRSAGPAVTSATKYSGISAAAHRMNSPSCRWRARHACSCHLPAVHTTFTRRFITGIRIHTRRISSASPLSSSRVAGPNSVREVSEPSPGFAVCVIERVVCRGNAVGLGVWMFVGDHIDGGQGVRSQTTRARCDASTGKGKVQQPLERRAELFRRGQFGRILLRLSHVDPGRPARAVRPDMTDMRRPA